MMKKSGDFWSYMITVIFVLGWLIFVILFLCMEGEVDKSRTLTILGLSFGALSSIFFGIGLLKPDLGIAETFCGSNPKAKAVLMMDKMNAVLGFVCLFLAFSLQILGVML